RAPLGNHVVGIERILRDQLREPAQHRTQRVLVDCVQSNRVSGDVLSQQFTVSIDDVTPGRRKRRRAQACGLGVEAVLVGVEYLGAEEGCRQQHERQPQHQSRLAGALAHLPRGECGHRSIRIASQSRNSTTTTTPTRAVPSPCSGDQSSASETSEPTLAPESSSTSRFRTHVPTKNNPALTAMLSAKNTALPHAAAQPIITCARMLAPNRPAESTSITSPTASPITAAVPGDALRHSSSSASSRKSGAPRLSTSDGQR